MYCGDITMNKLLPYSDIEILARIAQRRAMNHKIQQEEINDRRLALDQYVAEQLDAANIDKTLLSDTLSREVIFNTLSSQFQYTKTPENIAKLANMKAQANAILPDDIKCERWSTGDCNCTVQRIYHKDTPENSQTFHKVNGACHADLNINDLHDTINEETHRRGNMHRHLHEAYVGIISEIGPDGAIRNKNGVDIKFTWEGNNKERILVIDVTGAVLTTKDKGDIIASANRLFGKKVIKGIDTELVKVK